MAGADSRGDRVVFATRARPAVVAILGALAVLGALVAPAAGATPSGPTPSGAHSSYVVQHEATVTANASSPNRAHRLVAPGALLVAVGAAAFGALRIGSRTRTRGRRRVEQFHVRRRGPPPLIVAH